MTKAEQFKHLVDENLFDHEWYDGEEEIAQGANDRILVENFRGQGFFRRNQIHFNDGSKVVRYGVSVKVI